MAKKAQASASVSAPSHSAEAIAKVFEIIKENAVEMVDLRFTDPRGKWHHTTQYVTTIEEDTFREGFMFDGSSIAGGKPSTKAT